MFTHETGRQNVCREWELYQKHRCVMHGVFKGFKFCFWRMQINMRRVKINHLLFIAKDLTMCIKLRNCDILYQFHLWLFLDSVCVGKFCILMSSKLLYPRISRTPNFERFFPWKKCGPYAGKYGNYVGWVCCWFSSLLREVFLQVLRFYPLLKNQHFQIPIQPGFQSFRLAECTCARLEDRDHYYYYYWFMLGFLLKVMVLYYVLPTSLNK